MCKMSGSFTLVPILEGFFFPLSNFDMMGIIFVLSCYILLCFVSSPRSPFFSNKRNGIDIRGKGSGQKLGA